MVECNGQCCLNKFVSMLERLAYSGLKKKNYSRQLFGLVTTKNDYEKPFKQRGVEQIRKLWLTTLDEIKALLGTG